MKIHSTYMGLNINSPIVVSACTLSEQTDNIVKMEDNGAGAVVMFSLFEEQIKKEEIKFRNVISGTTYSFPEALDYFPDVDDYNIGIDDYLENIRIAKEKVNIPVIRSLNGISTK